MRLSILCAMRDTDVARRLSMELEDGGHCAFRIVTSGRAALHAAQRHAPDILIVDAVLPEMDGLGLIDRMREMLGARMPRVIGGSMHHFADMGFLHRGADRLVCVPWDKEELRAALLLEMERIWGGIDWHEAEDMHFRACALLSDIGMRSALKGYDYLAWAAVLAYTKEARLEAVCERIYKPIAEEFGTTAQNVERLIRHAVERTMDGERAKGVYRFFGNTIDPTRGKPTNAQCISALAERLRVS